MSQPLAANKPPVLMPLVWADFLERSRRYSFLITLGATILAGYLLVPSRGARYTAGLHIYDLQDPSLYFRGLHNSAWIGGMMALMTSLFLSLFGFYLVKNALERDRETGVGEILAATPLPSHLYVLGKWLSNLLVLLAIVGILVVAAIAMQCIRGEVLRVDLWALLSPFLIIAIPVLALTAATALLFETLPGLRGGLGNVVYFFCWIGTFVVGLVDSLFGVGLIESSVMAAARQAFSQVQLANSVGVDWESTYITLGHLQTFLWEGIRWTPEMLLGRLWWVGVALGCVFLAAVLFDRFDPSRGPRLRPARLTEHAYPEGEPEAAGEPSAAVPTLAPVLTPAPLRLGFWPALVAELRLALKEMRWWWYVVAGGLIVACLFAPEGELRHVLLPLAWLWPLLIWSAMGVRDRRHGTEQLMATAPYGLRRRLPALWLAGVAVAAIAGSGALLRLLAAGDWAGMLAWTAGVFFIPSLALALGVWSGTSKLFEVVYVAWWYAAVNGIVPLDFMGVTAGPEGVICSLFDRVVGMPWIYLGLSALLLALAALGWRRRLGD